jgi:murein tripeptide amidase MpaA
LISIDLKDSGQLVKICPNVDRVFINEGRLYLNADNDQITLIKNNGIKFEPYKIPDVRKTAAVAGDINGLFHDYKETEDFLNSLHDSFPELTEIGSAGFSIEGRNLFYIKITNPGSATASKSNIYILGCHHAREWISVEVPLLFAQYLLENYGSNPQAARAVNGSVIYILPIVNPDGQEYSIHNYRMWRKNRKDNGYYNSYGVDINRNYGYFWSYDDDGSSPNPWSEVYRGAYAFSEPETQAIRNLLQANPPTGLITYHSYSQSILYAWNYMNQTTTDDAEMQTIAKNMADLIKQVNGRQYIYGNGADALYTTNGDTVDYVYGTYKVPAYTIELPPVEFISGGFIISEDEINSVFNENLPALLYFVNYFIKNQP